MRKSRLCPHIDECKVKVPEETFRMFCTSGRYEKCIHYNVFFARRQTPKEWLEQEEAE